MQQDGVELLERLSKVVMELTLLVAHLVESHDAALVSRTTELASEARDLHHQIQALSYAGDRAP